MGSTYFAITSENIRNHLHECSFRGSIAREVVEWEFGALKVENGIPKHPFWSGRKAGQGTQAVVCFSGQVVREEKTEGVIEGENRQKTPSEPKLAGKVR